MLVKCKLCASKGEAKRLIQQGGVTVNGEKATDFAMAFTSADFGDGIKIKKGKKVFHKATLK
jgi:tyrosyl-tRNA synthetase